MNNSSLVKSSGGQPPAIVTLADPGTAARFDEPVTLPGLIKILWKRKRFIISIALISTIIAFLFLQRIPPFYSAESLLIIENRTPSIIKVENTVAGLSEDETSIQSEMEILRSPHLARQVIQRLELNKRPEFNPALRKPGWLKMALSLNIAESIASVKPVIEASEEAFNQVDVLNEFMAHLNVSRRGNSRVLAVEFTSRDPELATNAVNTLLEIYSRDQRQSIFPATDSLNSEIVELRAKLEASERAVDEYRKNAGLLQNAQGASLDSQQLSELNTQLTLASKQRSEAQTRLDHIHKLVNAGRVESLHEVLDSALIQNLHTQQTELQRKATELSTEYGEQHPFIVSLNTEIDGLKNRIRQETDRVVEDLENQVAIAQTREQSLRESVNALNKPVGAASDNEKPAELRALEHQAEANRALLDSLLSHESETSQQNPDDVQQVGARIVSLADVPAHPSGPKKGAILAMVFFGSSLLSMLITLLAEQRDRGFRASNQIERVTGIAVIGTVPMLKKAGLNPLKLFSRKRSYRRRSMMRESIRNIYANLFLERHETPPRTLLITSSVPREGKTAIAVNLARIQRLVDKKVVVIDTDFRSPGIHHAFDAPRTPGLAELISGEAELHDVLQRDGHTDTYFITAGKAQVDPLALLTSAKFTESLDILSELYDLVILDAPPSSTFADARVLSSKVDKTIFIVRWGYASKQLVSTTLRRFTRSSGNLGGIVLSMVNHKSNDAYGHSYPYAEE